MLTREHFLKAADLIEEKGLGRHSYYDSNSDCMCTVGALAYVAGAARPNDKRYGEVDVDEGGMRTTTSDIRFHNWIDAWPTRSLEKDFSQFISVNNDKSSYAVERWSDKSSQEEVVAKLREFGSMKDEQSANQDRYSAG